MLADGSAYPPQGPDQVRRPDFSQETGTFLVRAALPNPKALLRPGKFVRVRVLGAVRPNAIVVPQLAVLQGANGHFVVLVDKDGKAQMRPVEVGPGTATTGSSPHGLASRRPGGGRRRRAAVPRRAGEDRRAPAQAAEAATGGRAQRRAAKK